MKNDPSHDKSEWKVSDAWLAALTLVLFEVVRYESVRIAGRSQTPAFWWVTQYSFENALKIFRACSWLAIAFWFSKARSVREFVAGTALGQRPTAQGWWGVCLAIGIALVDHYGVVKGWTAPNLYYRDLFHQPGWALAVYILFVVSLRPFYEEVVIRGFLYRALRGSFAPILSALMVICFAAIIAIPHSAYTAACMVSLWILLCVIRERTGNVWNCVLAHAAYNAVGLVPFWLSPGH